MKKLVNYFVFLIVFLVCIPIRSVFAAADYKISYDVTEFSITKEEIIFKGFSFLDHMDNYGGRNMQTYIAAYSGGWNSQWNNINKCKGSDRCYVVESTPSSYRSYDLYFIRCIGGACTEKNRAQRARNLKNGTEKYELNTCNHSGSASGVYYPDSHCAYHNVGFAVKFDFAKVKEKFSNSTVHFRIITKVKSSSSTKIDSSDIGIIPNSCKSVFGKSCNTKKEDAKYSYNYKVTSKVESGGKTYDVKEKRKMTVTLGGISDKVQFTADQASGSYGSAQSGNNSYANNIRGRMFNYGATYTVTNVEKFSSGWNNWKGDRTGTVAGRLFYLEGINGDSGDKGWGWSAWVKSSGDLALKLKDEIDKTCNGCNCEDGQAVTCVGGNCHYDEETCKNDTTVKDLETNKDTATQNTCKNAENVVVNYDEVLHDTYYYPVDKSVIDSTLGDNTAATSNTGLQSSGGNYWVPIDLSVVVNIKQTFNVKLNEKFYEQMRKSVKSGQPFYFSVDYDTQLSVSGYSNRYDTSSNENSGTSQYNTYNNVLTFNVRDNKTGTITERRVLISLKEGDTIYNEVGGQSTSYGTGVYQDIVNKNASYSISDSNDKITVSFPDTNKPTQINSGAGIFTTIDDLAQNSRIGKYKVNQGWLSNNGEGKIVYGNKTSGYDVTNGDVSMYYVSPTWKTGEDFKVKIYGKFGIPGKTDFTYDATCHLNVINEIQDTKKLRYRSIDTSTPFPKGESSYPENWKEYIDSNGLNRITGNSFSAIGYQTNFFKNKSAIDGLKTTYGDYYSYKDMSTDGSATSLVVRNRGINDLFSKINGNHCKGGLYDPSCDKVQN